MVITIKANKMPIKNWEVGDIVATKKEQYRVADHRDDKVHLISLGKEDRVKPEYLIGTIEP